ncbi:MAG: hypothetical protein GF332_01980 [Candidatus Moranbacteria bacterium]|nr:hypothetical protein [Candidatus Moranbacteria bacterium]
MNKIKIFTQKDCPNCPPAKDLVHELEGQYPDLEVEKHRVDEADGLAEAQFYTVLATPTIIICDQDDHEITSFRGQVPDKQDLIKAIQPS